VASSESSRRWHIRTRAGIGKWSHWEQEETERRQTGPGLLLLWQLSHENHQKASHEVSYPKGSTSSQQCHSGDQATNHNGLLRGMQTIEPGYPSADKRTNKRLYICTMEYHSAFNRKEIMTEFNTDEPWRHYAIKYTSREAANTPWFLLCKFPRVVKSTRTRKKW
jgi:hypothetical protein